MSLGPGFNLFGHEFMRGSSIFLGGGGGGAGGCGGFRPDCIRVLGIQAICYFTFRDIGYYPFYLQGYGIFGTPLYKPPESSPDNVFRGCPMFFFFFLKIIIFQGFRGVQQFPVGVHVFSLKW